MVAYRRKEVLRLKVAIIGAGVTGLACALECERLGVYADVFERDHTVGWVWPSVSFWPSLFYRHTGDIVNHLKETYDVDLKPLGKCKNIIVKSLNRTTSIDGELGYFVARGKGEESVESQMKRCLRQTAIHFNRNADYKELAKRYDWVVISTGNESAARELAVWEDKGPVHVMGALVVGNFNPESTSLYFNRSYAGAGYARVTPFSSTQAIVGLYNIGCGEFEIDRLFYSFLEKEGLTKLDIIYRILPLPFTTGRVKKYRIRNILLAGRSAGFTERFMGVGAPEGIMSGILAARAIIRHEDYGKLVKEIRHHVENISSFRNVVEKFDDSSFDKLVETIDKPAVKKLVYNSKINLAGVAGGILKQLMK